tara:strand:+ start:217 stop:474 length:258 start_codon:yes stop_codon:yes gene_type:complete
MIKQFLIITAMLIAIGGCSSNIEKIEDREDRRDVMNAALGCDLNYAEAEALDEDEARLCRKRRLNADMKERSRCDVISGGACVNP